MNINTVTISGRLTDLPALRYTPNGAAVANFTVAVNKDKDTAYFFDCTAWKGTAEFIANNGTKGARVVVSGRLQQRRWEKDGQNHSKVEVVANTVELIDWPNDGQAGGVGGFDDLLPF